MLDDVRMIGEHDSYHQSITGEEAERRLKKHNHHCYLTRYSKAQKSYMLSVYEYQRPLHVYEHFKIVFNDENKIHIEGKNTPFDNIHALLHHYEQNRINPSLKTIGRAYTEEQHRAKLCTIL